MAKKRKGRPKSDSVQNDAIASAVHQLTSWGFAQNRRTFVAVSDAAKQVFGRLGIGDSLLGPDRIEQLYKQWVADQLELRSFARWRKTRTIPDVNPMFFRRGIYTKKSLERYRPAGTVEVLAKKLMKGWRPRSTAKTGYIGPPLEFTEKHLADIDEFMVRKPR
jgi:hypothetical protein